ncbi:hypothetical protein AB834_02910 [PVC group bacterium (ex Bugula neritina AB1)]|nr:hypothetical protein AB834_02910 [PVC group bacterium (ex Bugula neritina AB1)]
MPSINSFLEKEKKNKSKKTILSKSKSKINKSIEYSVGEEARPWEPEKLIKNKNKPSTNLVQSEYKPSTNLVQSEYKPSAKLSTNLVQSKYKLSTQPSTELSTNLVQKNKEINLDLSVKYLVGLQEKILHFIYRMALLNGSRTTEKLSIKFISESCKSSINSTRVTINRLISKGFLKRKSFKNGRLGWTIYYLPKPIYDEILNLVQSEYKLSTNLVQSEYKLSTQPSTELSTNASSSSSSIFNKTTTTKAIEENKSFDNWRSINFENLKSIGFSKAHIKQLFERNKLTVEEVQNSIDAFAYDLQKKDKSAEIKTTPLNFFMGILSKGVPYPFPEDYKSFEDQKREEYLVNLKKQQLKKEKTIKEIQDLKFQVWFEKTNETEKRELLPNFFKDKDLSSITAQTLLKEYFIKNIFDENYI